MKNTSILLLALFALPAATFGAEPGATVVIRTRADLEGIATNRVGAYALGADIDLSGAPWKPLFREESAPFAGTLDGNGHAISNLTVDIGGSCAGLFGRVGPDATITNLTLANPNAKGYGSVGALAGEANGATIAGCFVVGGTVVAGTGGEAGLLVGSLRSSTLLRCSALGTVESRGYNVGGLVGHLAGTNASLSECFMCGAVSAPASTSVGGFAGSVEGDPAVSDCYALADVKGGGCVGGFAGQLNGSDASFVRCYAAGTTAGSSDVGGFVGRQYRGEPTFEDCFRLEDGLGDVGAESRGGIAALDEDGMRSTNQFAAFHAADRGWAQTDGLTQPYFEWGLVDGGMTLSGRTVGSGSGAIEGLGVYAPGTAVAIEAVPEDSAFLSWTGDAAYDDRASAATTVLLDNFRFVVAEFGTLITNRQELAAITNALAGSYALGADIDLSDEAWTPLGSSSKPFTGSLYAQGHVISGLLCDDPSGNYAGLFAAVRDATLDGIRLVGVSVSGRQYTGALAGDVQGATAIRTCSAEGVVSNGQGYAGLLVGRVGGSGAIFQGCAATGLVESSGGDVGGLVGGVYSATVAFLGCAGNVAVRGSSGDGKGGFIGSVQGASAAPTFSSCLVFGAVTAPDSAGVGGFIGSASKACAFSECVARGAVSGKTGVGGFVGSASGGGSSFDSCGAAGGVKATGSRAGGFVGQSTAAGIRYERSMAVGGVAATSSDAGGFAGYVSSSNDFLRCMAAGAATAAYDVGGFAGKLSGAGTTVAECFALGDATATRDGDALAGGFAGDVSSAAAFGDSYSLGVAKGRQIVGGFAGRNGDGATTLARCYAAGLVDCSGAYAGAFAGRLSGTPTFADCAALCDGIHAVGSSSAASSAENDDIAEYDAEGMKSAANFAAWLAIDDADGSVWNQADGVTQPYLAWSAANGLEVFASAGGSAPGRVEVEGAGQYDPGSTVTVGAESDEGFFVAWTGSTPYADPASATTTIVLDNHRVAAARFGRLIATADELDAVRDDLAGVYGLGADIDLAGVDWTPIGTSSAPFAGTLHGFGHSISNLVATNVPSAKGCGLFGWTGGATLDGIVLSGAVRGGGYYTGGLVGNAAGTRIADCVLDVDVSSSSQWTGGLVGLVGDGTVVEDCTVSGRVSGASDGTGGLAGGIEGASAEVRGCIAEADVAGTGAVGGFAGRIASGSLVEDCAFVGTVSGSATQLGGFAGYLFGTPSVVRCSAVGMARKTSGSGSGYVGGFVGQQAGGLVADSYAHVSVGAGGAGYAGGFVGGSAGSRIERAYCSGRVSSTASGYVGAFGGRLGANAVTNSYYDAGATAQLAQGQNNKAAVDCPGIDPVASEDMTSQGSFVAFDFAETWRIDDGTMPYLRQPYAFEIAGYATWLQFRAGLPEDTPPEAMVNGIPAVARYLFDIPPDSMTNEDGDPVLRIHIAADGSPWLSFPARKNPNEHRAEFYVESSPDVDDWTDGNVVVSDEIDLDTGVYVPGYDPVPEKMFFRYRIVIPD